MRPVENGDIFAPVAERQRLVHDAHDFLGLRFAVVDAVEAWQFTVRRARRAQDFLELPRSVAHDGVRDGEYLRSAAVVAFEFDDAAALPALGEVEDVGDSRAAPRVDALEIVADGHDVAVPRRQDVRELRLQAVCVLVFVHEDVAEVLLQAFAHVVVFLEQAEAVDEEVIEVHYAHRLFSGGV